MMLSRSAMLGSLGATLAFPCAALADGAAAPIAVGAVPNESDGTVLYAQDLGLFAKAGLNVTLTVVTNPAPMHAAVTSGSIAIAGFPLSQAALAKARGIPLVMIAAGALYLSNALTNALLVLKDAPIKSAADLNGKTIATRDLANMSSLGARAWVDKNGGDSKSLRWLEIPDPEDVAALQSRRVDAASISEPALSNALRSGQATLLSHAFDAIAPRFLIAGYFTTEAFAAANPDVVRRFATVINDAAHWANQPKNRPQSGAILAKYAMIPVFPDTTRFTYAEEIRVADMQPVLDTLLTYGYLKAPMRAADLISPDFRPT
jgi:NitT/TauT family transport system substrate-binding protein